MATRFAGTVAIGKFTISRPSVMPGRAALSLLLSLFAIASAVAAEPSRRPNVVILVADDVGWADVGYHNAEIRTPRIDALVKAGVEFDAHYVMPACTPTRVALLTGKYPSRWGNHCTQAANDRALPPNTPTLASMLQAANYRTALIGKWHLGSKPEWGPNLFGFDHSFGSLAGSIGPYHHRYRHTRPQFEQTFHRNHEFIQEEGHITDLTAREAVSWIEDQSPDQPFFLYVPFNAAHLPLEEDATWLDRNDHIASDDRRLFAAAMTHLDHAVGQIVDALERTGHREQTLLLFFSDNGGLISHAGGKYTPPDPPLENLSSNLPFRGRKAETYEGGIRVPAFANWPGHLEPGRVDWPLHVVDWLPTLARQTRCELPPELADTDGRDIWPVVTGEISRPPARTLYWVKGERRDWVAVRHGDWKIVRQRNENWQLYNLADDPGEQTDRAADEPDKLAEMIRRHDWEWSQDGGTATLFDGTLDGWVTANGQPIERGWEVVDGVIHFRPTQPRAGFVLSRRPVGNFEFSFEWKIGKGGNSGIKYRVHNFDGRWRGCEYQMIDDDGYHYKIAPEQSTAALYGLYAPRDTKRLHPPGEFNHGMIRVVDHRIEHWLNGERVVSATVGSADWEARVRSSKFADDRGFGTHPIGPLMLTDHTSEAWFRNLHFKSLPATQAGKTRFLRDAAKND